MKRVAVIALLIVSGCGKVENATPPVPENSVPKKPEPERIQVQHILISFAGAGTRATRPKEAAEKLAGEVLARAKAGEEFGTLVKEFSDDSGAGIYGICNHGQSPQAPGEYPRGGMVPAFGNVGFALEVGGIGLAPFDRQASPYGWHIIKRLK